MRVPSQVVVAIGLIMAGGCSSQTADGPASGPARPRVAFVSNNPEEFWAIARRGTEQAARDFDVEVTFQMPARGTAPEQRQIVEDLVARGIQGIAISPNDSKNQARFLDEIAERVPLVTQDSDLPPGSKRICFIGTDNYEAGKAAGQLVKQAMPDGGRVVVFVGKLDVQNAIERRQGLMDELAGTRDATGPQLGDYTLLDTKTDDVQSDRCKANAEDILTLHGRDEAPLCLVGLWAYNPPAILRAVKEFSGAQPGKISIVGFDEYDATLNGIEAGEIVGTIVQQPYQFGYEAVRVLAAVVRGDRSVLPPDGVQYMPHRTITAENVAEFRDELRRLKGT